MAQNKDERSWFEAVSPWDVLSSIGPAIMSGLYSKNLNTGEDARLKEIQQYKLNTASERNASERITSKVAQFQPSATPHEEDLDPLMLLTATLEAQAAQQTVYAVQQGQEAARFSEALRTLPEYQSNVNAASDNLDSYYAGIVPRGSVINVFPAGSRVITGGKLPGGGRIKQEVDPRSGDIIVFEDIPKRESQSYRSNDQKVMAAVINQHGASPSTEFNLKEARERLATLSGNAALDYMGTIITNIDLQMNKEAQRIRETATIQGGYASARASYEMNMLNDATAIMQNGIPFRTLGQASAQTIQAQALMSANLDIATKLEAGFIRTDPKLGELRAYREELTKIQIERARRQERQEERAEARTDAAAIREQERKDRERERVDFLTTNVTTPQVTNYRRLFDKEVSDRDARIAIIQRQDKDPDFRRLINAGPSNITNLMVDVDPEVRAGAFKLALEYEKSVNPALASDATTSPTIEAIKELIKNPKLLVEKFGPQNQEQKAALLQRIKVPGTNKEARDATRNEIAALLGSAIEGVIRNEFKIDTRRWGIVHPELQKTMNEISSAAPNSKAPFDLIVESFINRDVPGPDGKNLNVAQKIQILDESITKGMTSVPKSMFMTPESVNALSEQLRNETKNASARIFIRKLTLGAAQAGGTLFGLHTGIAARLIGNQFVDTK